MRRSGRSRDGPIRKEGTPGPWARGAPPWKPRNAHGTPARRGRPDGRRADGDAADRRGHHRRAGDLAGARRDQLRGAHGDRHDRRRLRRRLRGRRRCGAPRTRPTRTATARATPTSASAGPIRNRADSDGDGVTDGEEARRGTNPLEDDTDGDGLPTPTRSRPAPTPQRRQRRRRAERPRGVRARDRSARAATPTATASATARSSSRTPTRSPPTPTGTARTTARTTTRSSTPAGVDDAVKGAVCGDSCALFCPDEDDPSRATTEYILGQMLSGLVAVGDIRDGVDALLRGQVRRRVLVGGRASSPRSATRRRSARRSTTSSRSSPAARPRRSALIYKLFPDGKLRRAALDAATDGGASALRNSGLSDEAIEQLARKGNDLRKLADNARLGSRTLDPTEAKAIDDAVARHWPNGAAVGGVRRRDGAGRAAPQPEHRDPPQRAARSGQAGQRPRHRRRRHAHGPHDRRRGEEHGRRQAAEPHAAALDRRRAAR